MSYWCWCWCCWFPSSSSFSSPPCPSSFSSSPSCPPSPPCPPSPSSFSSLILRRSNVHSLHLQVMLELLQESVVLQVVDQVKEEEQQQQKDPLPSICSGSSQTSPLCSILARSPPQQRRHCKSLLQMP